MDIEGGNCIRLTYQDGNNNVYWPVPNDIIDKLEDKYGYDITAYCMCLVQPYNFQAWKFELMLPIDNAACDCSINGSGEVSINNIPTDGSTPQCFYNIKCQYAEVCCESLSRAQLLMMKHLLIGT
jgi:hypothetical protein